MHLDHQCNINLIAHMNRSDKKTRKKA